MVPRVPHHRLARPPPPPTYPPPVLELCSLSTEKTRREREPSGNLPMAPLPRTGWHHTPTPEHARYKCACVCVCARECMLDGRSVHMVYIRALRMATVPPLTLSRLKRRRAEAATRKTAAPPSAPTAPAPAATHASPAPGARAEIDPESDPPLPKGAG